jgi:hypothetical protein
MGFTTNLSPHYQRLLSGLNVHLARQEKSRIRFMEPATQPERPANFGLAWFLLCLAFCSHAADEALTGFLGVYNPTVIAMRARLGWFPMLTYEYRDWLTGLIVVNIIFLGLTPFAYRNARALRPLAYFLPG